jgi:hypothetical protein
MSSIACLIIICPCRQPDPRLLHGIICIFACCIHRLVPRVDFSQGACSEYVRGEGELDRSGAGYYAVVVGIIRYHVLNPKSAFIALANPDVWIEIT